VSGIVLGIRSARLNRTIFRLWFTAYQQEKPLFQHIKLMNAARKEAIEYSSDFLTTPVDPRLFFGGLGSDI
jgi:hypothetical protein